MEMFLKAMTLVANVAVAITATALFVAFLWWASYVQDPATTKQQFETAKQIMIGEMK